MSAVDERLAGLTPAQRALLLRRLAGKAAAPAPAAAPQPADVTETREEVRIAEVSLAQEEYWLLDRLDPGNPSANISYPVRLRGPLDAGALERALGEIVRRHQALRTTFPLMDGRPVQRIAPPGAFGIETHDLSALDPDGREAGVRARIHAEAGHRFRLDEGPLLRATLLRLGDAEHVLIIVLHHIISDGWSLDVLFRELAELYDAFAHGRPSPLPPLRTQYADWAAWQREQVRGERMQALLAYWRDALSGAPAVLHLPADRPRAATPLQRGGWHTFTLAAPVAEGLRTLARAEGATTFAALLTVFEALLLRWTGQPDLVVGTATANRTRVEDEGLIGYFINTLVLRTRLHGDPTFRQALGRVRDATTGAFAHQELPFETMVHTLRLPVQPGTPPVFQVQFLYQNATGPLRLPGLQAELLRSVHSATEFDLTLNAVEHDFNTAEGYDGGFACAFEYSADLFDAATIERLAAVLAVLAAAAVAAPDLPLSALPLPDGALERIGRRDVNRPAPAPVITADDADGDRAWHLLPLTARTPSGLDAAAADLARHLRAHPELALADVARTLAARRAFPHRRALVVRRGEDAAAVIEPPAPRRVIEGRADTVDPPVAFLFTGRLDTGAGRELYDAEPVFRAEVDRCAGILRPHLGGTDIRPHEPAGTMPIEHAQPAAFVMEYALAALWRSWGVEPWAVAGRGVGELAAACVAGVLPLEAALEIVAQRARLIGGLPRGAAIRVPLPAGEVAPFLVHGAAIAEVLSPSACVVAGRREPVADVERRLRDAGYSPDHAETDFAFGSPLARLATAEIYPLVARIPLSPPRIPLVSAAAGTWLSDAQAMDPLHWARQLREPVQLHSALAALLAEPGGIVLPMDVSGAIFSANDVAAAADAATGARPPAADAALPGSARLLLALGHLWTTGASPRWQSVSPGRHRPVPLPPEREDSETVAHGWSDLKEAHGITPPHPSSRDADSIETEDSTTLDVTRAFGADYGESGNGFAEPADTSTSEYPEPSYEDVMDIGGVQERLADIWAELLGVRPKPTDDFFLLGGHSLLATQLMARVRDAFGVELDLRHVFNARDLASLAAGIESLAVDAPESITYEEAMALL